MHFQSKTNKTFKGSYMMISKRTRYGIHNDSDTLLTALSFPVFPCRAGGLQKYLIILRSLLNK